MPRYSVIFRTNADYATRDFDARSPHHALRKARRFYDERPEDLMFEEHVGGHPVNEIAVRDPDGNPIALWQDDELRVRLAADDMLKTLRLCLECLADPARRHDSPLSLRAVNQARAVIAKAKSEAAPGPHTNDRQLPPDPEQMNGDRADWAAAALRQFQCATGCDDTDSLSDLLCDLMHWSDRNNFEFQAALNRARDHYEAETAADPP